MFSNESHVFGGLFTLPQPHPVESGDIEGSSMSNPIILPDQFLKEDFHSLMKALYPLSFSLNLKLSKAEWISVLKLSTQWYFTNLRKAAISELERIKELTSVKKVLLGRKYRISSWIISGFSDLVNRQSTINDEAIGVDTDYVTTAYRLFRLREERIKLQEGRTIPSSYSVTGHIQTLFSVELEIIQTDEKSHKMNQETEEMAFKPDSGNDISPRRAPFAKNSVWDYNDM